MSRSPHHRATGDAKLTALLHELRLHDDAAELRQLAELCRRSLRVRTWLFSRFAREPVTQDVFRAFLKDPSSSTAGLWSRVLAAEVASRPDPAAPGPYGGLSETALWALLHELQAGGIDVRAFVLVRLWRKLADGDRLPPPALWRVTLEYWRDIATARDAGPARQVAQAVKFFAEAEDGGPVDDNWKLHLLLHILDHPQPSYRTRDLIAALPAKYRRLRANGNPFVDPREVRKFCHAHGIARDVRAGRPARAPVRAR